MDHTGQVIALIGAILVPLAGALATWLRAVAKNLYDNNRGQNAALLTLQKELAEIKKASGLPASPPPTPPPTRRAKRESRFYPRAVTPLPFHPITPNKEPER